MPITSTTQAQYVLANATADMDSMHVVANLRWIVDGKDCGLIEVVVQGEDFAQALAAPPIPGLTRADDIVTMIYQYALSKGIVSGEIS